jgi:hypothetical protein
VAAEVWGQTVQGFFDSQDGGRDGAFYGTWRSGKGETFDGSFTIQCKFSQKSGRSINIASLRDEIEKAKRLASRGLTDNYFLFTNMQLTGLTDEAIRREFESIPDLKRCRVYGVEQISQFIRESPRLRMLVPRVYGLGDLSQILDQRAYDQAQEILSALGDDMNKFVMTDAFRASTRAIVEHGFVLLLGEPACGKSTIAAALALGALDEWNCFTVKVRDPSEFVATSNPHEKQFFWVDDAFGTTQLDWHEWSATFPHIRAAIRRGAKFVFTSRDYIYKNARNFLKESALPVIQDSQVIIRVEQLSKDEREQILYNHIRLGTQTTIFKRQLKTYLHDVAAHARFSPEIARRLGKLLEHEGILDYSGHVSTRIPGKEALVIQVGSASRAEVTRESMLVVSFDGKVLAGDGQPPSELPIHVEILKARPDVQSVLHAHMALAIAFTMMEGVTLMPMRARASRWKSGISDSSRSKPHQAR